MTQSKSAIKKTILRINPAFMVLTILLIALWALQVKANDAAVETAAGGLQLRNEQRVSIVKERLFISKKDIGPVPTNLPNLQNQYRVIVEYEFLNESTENVSTEVAFPLPEFRYPWEDLIPDRKIRGFKLEVDGKVVSYATKVRAIAGGHDVTDLLNRVGIEIESFGRFAHDSKVNSYQVMRLPVETQVRLKTAGVIDADLDPMWAVAITYHWKQIFPAGRIIRVRHEYEAIPGFSYGFEVPKYLSYLKDGCFDAGLKRGLEAAQAPTATQVLQRVQGGEAIGA